MMDFLIAEIEFVTKNMLDLVEHLSFYRDEYKKIQGMFNS